MQIVKVRLARDIGGIYESMNRMMDEVLNLNRPFLPRCGGGWVPEADMVETEDDLLLCVNLAGVRREDIEVAFDETYLRIEGRRLPTPSPQSKTRYHRLEMGFGEFERVFRIPIRIDPNRIEASLVDGVLTIRMAKPDKG